ELDLVGAPAALPTLGQDAADLFEDEAVGFAEARERTGLRADVTDLDDAALGVGRDHPQHRRRRNGAEAGADERPTRNGGVKIVRCVLGHISLRCRIRSLWSLPDASHCDRSAIGDASLLEMLQHVRPQRGLRSRAPRAKALARFEAELALRH